MNINLLNGGGDTIEDRFKVALPHSGLKPEGQRTIRDLFENVYVQKKLWVPLYVDPGSDYGKRWGDLFDLIANTEDHQTIIIARGQFFPMLDHNTLHKRWYILPALRWDHNRHPMLSSREALQQRLDSYRLKDIHKLMDVAIALDFQGIGKDGDYRITTPFDWLRARIMYEAWKDQLKIVIREGREDLSEAFNQGVIIEAKGVPSLSGEQAPHEIVARNVAVYDGSFGPTDMTRIVSYGLRTSDDCSRHTFSQEKFYRRMNPAFGYVKRTGEEIDIDHHTGLIILAAAEAMPRQRPGLGVYNPLPEVPKGVEQLVDVAYKRIMITEGEDNGRHMLWEFNGLMKIYTMMAVAYLNTKQRQEQRAAVKGAVA